MILLFCLFARNGFLCNRTKILEIGYFFAFVLYIKVNGGIIDYYVAGIPALKLANINFRRFFDVWEIVFGE